MPKDLGYPKGHKGHIATVDKAMPGGQHGRGTQSHMKGQAPAGAKKARPTGTTQVAWPMRRTH